MLLEVIKNKLKLIALGLIGFTILQTLSLHTLVDQLPFFILLLDTFIYSILYFFIVIPLLNVIRFGKMNLLAPPVRVVNYVALSVVTLGLTIGTAYLIEFLFFSEDYHAVFNALIPVRFFSSILVYLLILLLCLKYEGEQESKEVKEETEETKSDPGNNALIERVAVKSGTKIHVVPVTEIICLLADGDYVQVVTEKGKFLKEQTMKHFETHLPDNQFIRVHRSCIVNVDAISRIELYEKQSQQLMLKNGHKIKVSQADRLWRL